MTLPATPSQTVGPFFGYALPVPGGNELVPPGSPGSAVLHGRVLDGAGEPVPDALLEIRQADVDGRVPTTTGSLHRDGHTFTGWGRAETDDDGWWTFHTRRPGCRPGRPAFVSLLVVARGLLRHQHTRAYLPADEALLLADPLLAALPADRRETLLTHEDSQGRLRFDIHLQGDAETVFLRFDGYGDSTADGPADG